MPSPVLMVLLLLMAVGPYNFNYAHGDKLPNTQVKPKVHPVSATVRAAVSIAVKAMGKGQKDLSDLPPAAPIKKPSELAKKNGYPVTEYQVKTPDGYYLSLDRIPNPGRPVVFIGSALLCSTAIYMLLGKMSIVEQLRRKTFDSSTTHLVPAGWAMKLHDRGYDVWLGNMRGNGVSTKHDKWSTNDAKFWDFSFHEHGAIDIPTFIDFILRETKRRRLAYIGYSEGSLAFYVLASERPEYSAKVSAAFLMAPPVFMYHQTEQINFLGQAFENKTEQILQDITGDWRMYNMKPLLRMFKYRACPKLRNTPLTCEHKKLQHANLAGTGHLLYIPHLHNYYPADASVKEVRHFLQLVDPAWAGFRKFNYGAARNRRLYGQDCPPDYDLNKVNIPVYHYFGSTDHLAPSQQESDFLKRVKTIKKCYVTPEKKFGHSDFMFGTRASTMFDVLIADMDNLYEK